MSNPNANEATDENERLANAIAATHGFDRASAVVEAQEPSAQIAASGSTEPTPALSDERAIRAKPLGVSSSGDDWDGCEVSLVRHDDFEWLVARNARLRLVATNLAEALSAILDKITAEAAASDDGWRIRTALLFEAMKNARAALAVWDQGETK